MAARSAADVPYVQSRVYMDTVVTIEVVRPGMTDYVHAVERAFGWFAEVEARCSRFDPESELVQLCRRAPGTAERVSPLLFALLEFALALAKESDGAFDPTVGATMERRGFDRNYANGEQVSLRNGTSRRVNWRAIVLDTVNQTLRFEEPLLLDLGAVAKGFAIDLAARELASEPAGLHDFAINAGGDIFVSGHNSDGAPWRLGIRHPRDAGGLLRTLSVADGAVCTSGDYERTAPGGVLHIVEPDCATNTSSVASVTVMAPSAMVADGFSTAAFVLGPARGRELLERNGLDGLIVTTELDQIETPGFARCIQ